MVEYQVKRVTLVEKSNTAIADDPVEACRLFSRKTMISACLDVPQQNNSYDCGVFVLQYAEYFMKVSRVSTGVKRKSLCNYRLAIQNPLSDYNLRNINLSSWFPSYIAGRKRKNIQFLLIRLTKEMNPSADSVLNSLPKEDVKIALQDRQRSQTLPTLSTANNQDGAMQRADAVATEAMMEDGKASVVSQVKNTAKTAVRGEFMGDQEKNNGFEK